MIKRQGWRNVRQEGLADESCVNGATVISIDESILPVLYDTGLCIFKKILTAL